VQCRELFTALWVIKNEKPLDGVSRRGRWNKMPVYGDAEELAPLKVKRPSNFDR